jgi:nitrogen fixation NifU-like protein
MLSTQEEIFDRYKHPKFAGQLSASDYQKDGSNQSCGDEVHWELKLDPSGKIIEKLRHQSRACAICTVSADILAEKLQGKSIQEIGEFKLANLQEELGIQLSPARLKCLALPLETLQAILE